MPDNQSAVIMALDEWRDHVADAEREAVIDVLGGLRDVFLAAPTCSIVEMRLLIAYDLAIRLLEAAAEEMP